MWQTSPSLDWLVGWLAGWLLRKLLHIITTPHIYRAILFQQNETDGQRITTIIKIYFFFRKIFLNNLQVVFHNVQLTMSLKVL